MGIEFRNPSQFPINSDCENLRELIDTKRANRHCEELEDTTGVFPLLLVDVLQPTQGLNSATVVVTEHSTASAMETLRQKYMNLQPRTSRDGDDHS